jgi:hypothetical protein
MRGTLSPIAVASATKILLASWLEEMREISPRPNSRESHNIACGRNLHFLGIFEIPSSFSFIFLHSGTILKLSNNDAAAAKMTLAKDKQKCVVTPIYRMLPTNLPLTPGLSMMPLLKGANALSGLFSIALLYLKRSPWTLISRCRTSLKKIVCYSALVLELVAAAAKLPAAAAASSTSALPNAVSQFSFPIHLTIHSHAEEQKIGLLLVQWRQNITWD